MTFPRANPLGWALFEVLTSAQMNTVDINVSRAVDGLNGGVFPLQSGANGAGGIRFDGSSQVAALVGFTHLVEILPGDDNPGLKVSLPATSNVNSAAESALVVDASALQNENTYAANLIAPLTGTGTRSAGGSAVSGSLTGGDGIFAVGGNGAIASSTGGRGIIATGGVGDTQGGVGGEFRGGVTNGASGTGGSGVLALGAAESTTAVSAGPGTTSTGGAHSSDGAGGTGLIGTGGSSINGVAGSGAVLTGGVSGNNQVPGTGALITGANAVGTSVAGGTGLIVQGGDGGQDGGIGAVITGGSSTDEDGGDGVQGIGGDGNTEAGGLGVSGIGGDSTADIGGAGGQFVGGNGPSPSDGGAGVIAIGTDNGIGIEASSAGTGHAAALTGNSTRAALRLVPQSSPAVSIEGGLYYDTDRNRFAGNVTDSGLTANDQGIAMTSEVPYTWAILNSAANAGITIAKEVGRGAGTITYTLGSGIPNTINVTISPSLPDANFAVFMTYNFVTTNTLNGEAVFRTFGKAAASFSIQAEAGSSPLDLYAASFQLAIQIFVDD